VADMTLIQSPISGRVLVVSVKVGDPVGAGDALVIVESMKMEIPVEAEGAGVVVELMVEVGAEVNEGDSVARLRAA
jgi:acetyl-CoA carboxylase biotin carboxyl carrier protein